MGDEDEIRRLDERIDEETNETLDSSRRMLKVVVETNEIGQDTLTTLNEQGEKIHNVKQKFDEMKVDLGRADRNIREMEKVCGCCVCPPFGDRRRSGLHHDHHKKEDEKAKGYVEVITSQPEQGGDNSIGQSSYIKRVTGDKREDEINKNLGAVSKVLDNLGGVATEMASELDRQNKDLKELNNTAEDTEGHLIHSTHRLEHLR